MKIYSDLIEKFNSEQIKKYYDISNEDVEKIYYCIKNGKVIKGDLEKISIYTSV